MLRANRPLTCLVSSLILGMSLAACRDVVQSVPSSLAEHSTVGPAAAQGGLQTIDDRFAALTREVPGFGGLFYDSVGRLTVYLKRPETLSAVRPQLQHFLEDASSHKPDRLAEISREVAAARALPARYDFAELHDWYLAQIIAVIAPLDGVTMTDIDDRGNRITVGVQDAAARARVEGTLAGLSVPRDAVHVIEFAGVEIGSRGLARPFARHSGSMTAALDANDHAIPETRRSLGSARAVNSTLQLDHYLTDYLRPVPGGARVQAHWSSGVLANCTLAYNLILDGDPYHSYFLTNSHCTEVFGTVSYTPFGQPEWVASVGLEFADPPLRTSADDPLCPPGRLCRSSDAAVVQYNVSSYSDHPWVAFPPLGSTKFSEWRPVRDRADPEVGMTVDKIGATTGRTEGTVTEVCVNYRQYDQGFDTGRTMICQASANFAGDWGDSGSPVVRLNPDYTLTDLGLIWGPIDGAFSPSANYWGEFSKTYGYWFWSMAPDPPVLTVSINGPTRMKPNAECIYSSTVTGGTAPYFYQWHQDTTPIGNESSVTVSSSGYVSSFSLYLYVTDSQHGDGSAQKTVQISASAPACQF